MLPKAPYFPVEEIPDEDSLFYRIHKNDVQDGDVVPGAFRERGEGDQKGMSTEWSHYSDPQTCLNRQPAGVEIVNREATHGIVSFIVGAVRAIENLKVVHNPLPYNQAHAHILGIPLKKPLSTKVRNKLFFIYQWEIKPPIE